MGTNGKKKMKENGSSFCRRERDEEEYRYISLKKRQLQLSRGGGAGRKNHVE